MQIKSKIRDKIRINVRYATIIFIGLLLLCAAFSVQAAQSVVLSQADIQIYRQIFKAHQKGHYKTAESLLKKVRNHILDGYVLYDKYFSAKYKTQQKEIDLWLKKYKHLTIATDVYALAQKKNMKVSVSKPKDILFGGKSSACSYVRRDEPIDLLARRRFSYLQGNKQKKARQLYQQLIKQIKDGKTQAARRLIESDDFEALMNKSDMALAQTALAFSYFLDAEYDKSLDYAESAIQSDGNSVPLAYWTAGLTQWQRQKYKSAAEYFAQTAAHSEVYPLLRGSASFWAARAYLKTGNYRKVGDYLEAASQQPRTFYGMLAMRMLGVDLNHVWDVSDSPEDDVDIRFSHPTLNLFYALKQVGKYDWAKKELAKLYLESDKETQTILSAIAVRNGFKQDLSGVIGAMTTEKERFPAPDWEPTGGWKIDKSLVFAFVRQESCFNRRAKSVVGARGLMQIMPATARVMAKMAGLKWNLAYMDRVEYNLALGQKYIRYLLDLPAVQNNLIYLAVAYNAGPGNLIKWKKKTNYVSDPLVFIESIPSRETRSFVERIMVNYWVYRTLMNKSLDTIDSLIASEWPQYEP